MINKAHTTIIFLINFIFLQTIHGQVKMNVPEYLSQRFIKYCESVPREEIFVHTDRKEYIAGEDLWFNFYLIDRQSFKPSLNSRIAYFELLNSENRPVVQKRILINKGFGSGQIVLPDTLSTGKYTIRVYTRWMRNFLPVNCFMKEIRVYSSLSNKNFTDNSDNNFNGGISNANIADNGYKGLTLKVNNLKADTLEILVNTDIRYRSENRNIIYLFIQTHGNINHISSEKMTGETTKINVPKALLSPGINQITIFNAKGEPVGERFIYSPFREKKFLTLHSIDSCNKRSKISLEIELGNELSTQLDSTNLSISVAPRTNDPGIIDMNDYMVFGTEYGLLPMNTITGRKIGELPPEVLDSILINVRSNWINWAQILSGDTPHFKYPMEKEDHLLLGKLLTSDQKAVGSDEIILLCTPGKEAGFQYAGTDDEGNFSFNIHIDEGVKDLIIMPDDIKKNYKIIIESSFSDQYLQSEISVDSTQRPIPPYISDWSVNYQVKTIYGVSSHGGPLNPVFPPLKPMRFYGKPDIELIMADYIKLPVMHEVFFELLPHVSLKKKKSKYEISIADRVDDSRYVTSPCLLIDGVIINDPSSIANLDPEIVEKIDVIKEKYLVGSYPFFGIVNVITKSGDYSCVSLPDYMIRLPYRVIDRVWSFASPDYSSAETMNSRIPDFRNTLYWNPAVKPDKSGKARIEFWSSDVVSDYEINVQGITLEGKLISAKKFIRVE
ncbi:MAG: hypothetical protein WCS03_15050 [Bacteroidota bacterium]